MPPLHLDLRLQIMGRWTAHSGSKWWICNSTVEGDGPNRQGQHGGGGPGLHAILGKCCKGLGNIRSAISAKPLVALSVNLWPHSTKSEVRHQLKTSHCLLGPSINDSNCLNTKPFLFVCDGSKRKEFNNTRCTTKRTSNSFVYLRLDKQHS